MWKSLLIKLIGFPALLIHGDPLVLDRWLWLKKKLPQTRNDETLLDCGCGSGAFTIGTAKRGYITTGISNAKDDLESAKERALLLAPYRTNFEVVDIRELEKQSVFTENFDVALCLEVIEHISDDRGLMVDLSRCMKPGGRLLLTTPNYNYAAITSDEEGPWTEDNDHHGWHVRRGYTPMMLRELCDESGLVVEEITYCSGIVSQKLTKLLRALAKVRYMLGWSAILPFRILPPIFDRLLTNVIGWHYYSIGLEAYKPRFETSGSIGISTT